MCLILFLNMSDGSAPSIPVQFDRRVVIEINEVATITEVSQGEGNLEAKVSIHDEVGVQVVWP